MNRISAVIKIHFKDKFTWFYMPWIILLSSFVVNLIISYFVTDEYYTGGLVSIFVYMFVAGIIILVQTFPFALGLSVRRTDFFFGSILYFLIISFFTTTVLLILSLIESELLVGWGTELFFFHLPYLNDGSILEQFVVFFLFFMLMFMGGFMISSIQRRFGKAGTFTFLTVILLLSTVVTFLITQNEWWINIWNWIVLHTAFGLILWTIPATLIYGIVSFLLLRKTTV